MVKRAIPLALAGLVAVLGTAYAQQGPAPAKASTSAVADKIMVERAQAALEDPEAVAGSGWQESADATIAKEKAARGGQLQSIVDQQPTALQQALDKAAQTLNLPSPVAQKPGVAKQAPNVKYRIYLSQSMGDAAVREAMMDAVGREDTMLIFRGPKKGQTVNQLQLWLGNMVKDRVQKAEPLPNIFVDPTAFSDHDITVVPTVERVDESGKTIASVRGLFDTAWLETEVARGAKGDLGARGKTFPVAEIDLLAAMQEKVKNFDWEAWKQKAAADYWKKAPFTELPRATEARVRQIDPTVVVPKDIIAPNGTVVARAGDTFNPLDSMGFHQKLLIFDATDKAQLEYARKFLKDAAGTRVTLITTTMNRDEGFDGYVEMENELEHPVYMLNAPVRDTFHVEMVPTTVEATNKVFVVTEVPVHQGGK
ncbi:TrbC family F-type conjugative pilus assembly protein [Dyella sp. ASV21]|uniref:TrbC family F-type conjugative pilus assembly protein n=1 Tax=Dyella sp. ASV21 TaxID=2795114 RepID=UPI0018EAAD49|nr:TrbC family F-type conjugative pilus assembly protein [Dyella sp. ASV21]